MDRLEQLKQWAERARGEETPTPDIARRVRYTLERMTAPPVEESWWLGWAPRVALVAATVVFVFAGVQVWTAVTEPWTAWMDVLSEWWMV